MYVSNIVKSNYITINPPQYYQKERDNPQLTINGTPIKYASEIRYLVYYITANSISTSAHAQHIYVSTKAMIDQYILKG